MTIIEYTYIIHHKAWRYNENIFIEQRLSEVAFRCQNRGGCRVQAHAEQVYVSGICM